MATARGEVPVNSLVKGAAPARQRLGEERDVTLEPVNFETP